MSVFDWRIWRLACAVAVAALGVACAQVPKESVELSTTVGRDIAAAHEAHIKLAHTLFARMKGDVDRFVDDVYAPYQIQYVLAKQKERQQTGSPDNLFSVIETATARPNDAQAQKDVLLVMQSIVQHVHDDIEDYRRIRLAPILKQEQDVTAAIDRLYGQIEEGNAVVTAHLASVVKVHEVQDELLKKANLEGLREKVGIQLSNASSRLAEFVDKAKPVEGKIDDATGKIGKMTAELDKLLKGE